MKNGVFSVVFASALLGATSIAFAGAYGEAEQPEEIPAPVPAVVAPEPEPPAVMHEFSGFLTDAETTRGIWAEIGSMYAAEYHTHSGDADAVNTYAHLSYGSELFEVGLTMPYLYWHQDHIGESGDGDDGFGDLHMWGKIMPVRTDMFALGGGLIVSFPAGDDTFSTDEYGFEPFVTASVAAGPASIRGTVGYNVYTSPERGPSDAYDYVDYNAAVLVPVGERIVVRGELTGAHFVWSNLDPVSFVPGVDIKIPISDMEFLLRPTVGVGLTQEAPDWQLGIGFALNVREL